MKRNIIFLFTLIFTILYISGCQYKDINRRLFIMELGIDTLKDSDMIELTAKAAIPSTGGDGGGQKIDQQIYTVLSDSMGNALRLLKSQTSLEPEYSQMKTLLIGREYAENRPIDDIIDFCIRRRDIQNIAYIAIAEPSARDIVNCTPSDINIPGGEVFMKFKQGSESPYAEVTRTYQIFRSLKTPGETPYCPLASVKNNKVIINKVAVFSAVSHKMAHEFSPEDTLTFTILTNTAKNPFISATTEEGKTYGVNLNQFNTKFKFEKGADKDIICKVTINTKAITEQIQEQQIDNEKLSALISKELIERITAFLDKLQDERIDPLQLQMKYWAVTPSYEFSKGWIQEKFTEIKFKVKADVKIISTGLIQ